MKIWSKNIVVTMICAVFFLTFVAAQEEEKEEYSKFAIQYHVSSFLRLTNFEDNLFATKYHFTKSHALRVAGTFTSSAWENKYPGPRDTRRDKFQNYFAKVALSYLHFFNEVDQFRTYWGSGPFFTYRFVKETSEFDDPNAAALEGKSRYEYDFGASATLGVEWRVFRKLSLLFESGYVIFYRVVSWTDIRFGANYREDKAWYTNLSNAKLGLSIAL